VKGGKDLAFEVEVEFGKERAFRPSRIKEGTLVEVKNLFENLPARRAFLKNPRTETAKGVEIFKALLLGHPEVSASLYLDKKEALVWEGGELKGLFSQLFDLEETFLFQSSFERPPYSFLFLLTDTRRTFSHGRFLFFFINDRLIKDEKLTRFFYYLLKKYFGALGFPAGVIKIKVPPHLVDFNVHPAKWEVRFKQEREVLSLLEKALENHFRLKRGKTVRRPEEPKEVFRVKEDLPLSYPSSQERAPQTLLFREENLPSFKVLGAYLNTYLLVEKGEELYLVDQHALAERIHYENLKKRGFLGTPQRLLLPFLIKLTPEMLEDLEEKVRLLSELGFELEQVGSEDLLVKGAPLEVHEFAREILEELLRLTHFRPEEVFDQLLKELACLRARKKGDYLTSEEKSYLISLMFKEALETCPHGRPLFLKLTLAEIEKKLKRRPS